MLGKVPWGLIWVKSLASPNLSLWILKLALCNMSQASPSTLNSPTWERNGTASKLCVYQSSQRSNTPLRVLMAFWLKRPAASSVWIMVPQVSHSKNSKQTIPDIAGLTWWLEYMTQVSGALTQVCLTSWWDSKNSKFSWLESKSFKLSSQYCKEVTRGLVECLVMTCSYDLFLTWVRGGDSRLNSIHLQGTRSNLGNSIPSRLLCMVA